MPKAPHEALHHLFRDDPDLARRALKACLGEEFPEFLKVDAVDSDVSEIKAVVRQVDAAFKIETVQGVEYLIIEPQTRPPKAEKIRSWHWYLSYFESHFGRPASLIIITPQQDTAEECRRPLTLGPERRASALIRPHVIGPDNTPLITDPNQAAEDVMLAVMAALAHRLDPEIPAALDALAEALTATDIETAKFFAEYVEVGLGEGGAHDHWRSIIMSMTYPFASKLRAELAARARSEMLLDLFSIRGIKVTPEQRATVLDCTDETTHYEWLRRASTATSADEIFEPADG